MARSPRKATRPSGPARRKAAPELREWDAARDDLFKYRVKLLAVRKGKGVGACMIEMGLARDHMNEPRIKNGRTGGLILRMSTYFGVNPEYLMGWDRALQNTNDPDRQEEALLASQLPGNEDD